MRWKNKSYTFKGFIIGMSIAILPFLYLLITLFENNFNINDEKGILRALVFLLIALIIGVILLASFIGWMISKIKSK